MQSSNLSKIEDLISDSESIFKLVIFMKLNDKTYEHLQPEFIEASKFAIIFNPHLGIKNIKKDEHAFELFSSYTPYSYHLVLDKN